MALTFFSGAFVVPTLAGLLRLKVNKNNVILSMILGGVIALAGKIIFLSGYQLTGNIVIILSYLVNSILLFSRVRLKTSTKVG